MTMGEKAVELHAPGTNCAQCVLRSAAKFTNLDDLTATKIAEGFGGGVRSGEICGAITGGVMVLGLCGKANKTKVFVDEFETAFGSIRCRDLKGISGVPCDDLIEFSGNKLEEVLNNGTL